ncbi:MAG: adenosylcobinamide-GDP ribazoletransferase [Propionicimonas sp.]|nr:adenosylcobinamide-GDP ribazoletransferase [Propionicimonas sp.]
MADGLTVLAGLRLAVAFLTVIPVPPTSEITRPVARTAMLLGWFAVLPVALAAAVAGWAALLLGLPAVLAGAIVVGALALGTRAMHLDGLADTVDGLGSGPDREKALRIMRSGDVGPMGVVALVLVVLAQAVGFGAILERGGGWLLVVGLIAASRAALALGCAAGVPAARPDGLGALFASVVPVGWVVAVWVTVAAALSGLCWATGLPWWQGAVAAAAALAGCAVLLRRCVHRFGGSSGDVLGALVETALTLLVVASAW